MGRGLKAYFANTRNEPATWSHALDPPSLATGVGMISSSVDVDVLSSSATASRNSEWPFFSDNSTKSCCFSSSAIVEELLDAIVKVKVAK